MIQSEILPLVVAALAGLAMALQGSLNTLLNKTVGLWEATFIVHLLATGTVAALLFLGGVGTGELMRFGRAPWFSFLGGPIGVAITLGVVIAIKKVGMTYATTSIIVGQVLAATIIDHFGLFGVEKLAFSAFKLLGLFFLALGAKILLS